MYVQPYTYPYIIRTISDKKNDTPIKNRCIHLKVNI
jgi:hypothetical protein